MTQLNALNVKIIILILMDHAFQILSARIKEDLLKLTIKLNYAPRVIVIVHNVNLIRNYASSAQTKNTYYQMDHVSSLLIVIK
jgi:hypothetical protein